MVKNGYKHKTGIFGDDAEHYTSQLFEMYKNPNGSRRPDLVSINGNFAPKLSLEVKSGAKLKGVLVDYQLHYAITTEQDYEELFEDNLPQRNGHLPGLEVRLPRNHIAYYYNIINRVDGLRADDLDTPFSSIKIKWGDQFLVPHEWGFYAFAVSAHMRSGEPFQDIEDRLKKMMQSDILNGTSHYLDRKGNIQSWQDLHARDVLSVFLGDPSRATKLGQKRIELLRQYYPQMDDLKGVEIPGPNGTKIYVMAKPEEYNLMNTQLRHVVRHRVRKLEEVTQEREEAKELLERIRYIENPTLLYTEGIPKSMSMIKPLDDDEIRRLRRLQKWLAEGQFEIGKEDEHDTWRGSGNDIPEDPIYEEAPF